MNYLSDTRVELDENGRTPTAVRQEEDYLGTAELIIPVHWNNKTVMNWISGIPDPQEDVTTTIHNGPSAQIPTVTQGFSVLTGPQTGLSKKDKQISSQSTQLSQEEEVFGGLRAPIMKGFDSKGQTSKPIVTEGVASMVTTSPALTPGRHMLRRYSSTQNLRGSASRAEVSTGHKKAGGFANNS